jgi:hypothetical protein
MNQPVSSSIQSAESQGAYQPMPQQAAYEISGRPIQPQAYEMMGDSTHHRVYEMVADPVHHI